MAIACTNKVVTHKKCAVDPEDAERGFFRSEPASANQRPQVFRLASSPKSTSAAMTSPSMPASYCESNSFVNSTLPLRVNLSLGQAPGSRDGAAQESTGSQEYIFNVLNASPHAQKAAASVGQYDHPQFSGGTPEISNQGLLPDTSLWHLSNFDNTFYVRQSFMTPSANIQSHSEGRPQQPSPLVYNYPLPPPPYERASSTHVSLQTTRPPSQQPPMIALTECESPASPVSLVSDDKSCIVSPQGRRFSNASAPSLSAESLSMSDFQAEQDRSYKLPRILPPKRVGEPPRNNDGKLVCTVDARCENLNFERKCEWRRVFSHAQGSASGKANTFDSKHMDKHDRPYKCGYPQCSKLQGFTYSGGLLRHEREVHKKHGGPRESLMCPFKDCKRSTGAGFTRKENLNEHLRRVHRRADDESRARDEEQSAVDPDDLGEEHGEGEASPPLGKRKRQRQSAMSNIADSDDATPEDELQEEVKRLKRDNEEQRKQNAEKDAKIEFLEATIRHFAGQSR